MIRPLAPFTVRPLKLTRIRKSVSAVAITQLAEQLPSSIKATRRSVKSSAPRPQPSLRVIARDA